MSGTRPGREFRKGHGTPGRSFAPGFALITVTLFCCPPGLAQDSASAVQLPAEMAVHPAAFFQSGNDCGGSTSTVHIRLEPNSTGKVQVGFFEASAGAIGNMSKASGWMAALVATDILDDDLTRYRISFSRTDYIDGPSAGGLMTSGLIALLRGEAFPSNVGMTGTINPDGTIGPVGGIAQKIDGAARAKMTRFAIPLGLRRDANACTGEEQDLVELGRSLGVEVAEVGDIREAYAFLTGRSLATTPTAMPSLAIPDRYQTAYEGLYQDWEKRYEAAQHIVARARRDDFPPELQSFWAHAEALRETGQQELHNGHAPAAFNRIWMAVLNAEFTARAVRAMTALRTQGFPGLHQFVEQHITDVERIVSASLPEFRDVTVETVVDAGAVAWIGGQLATALAFLDQARSELSASRNLMQASRNFDPADVGALGFEALGHISVVGPVLDMALASKGWLGSGPSWRRVAAPINAALELFEATALSSLNYVDTLYTEPLAAAKRMDMKSAKNWLRRKDPAFLNATGAINQTGTLFDLFEDTYAGALAQLGALLSSVATSSLLVAQHYSLAEKSDKFGRAVEFHYEEAAERMMEYAEKTAKNALTEADRATSGASTPMLVVALDAADRNRAHPLMAQDNLTALSLYWSVSLNARLMTRLAHGR